MQQESELADLMMNAIKQGLEGLVVKDVKVQITLAHCTLASYLDLGTRLTEHMCLWCVSEIKVLNLLDCCLQSVYEPGKRHWLKMKKDYLAGGAMADTADLIVLGAYYGTGNKG